MKITRRQFIKGAAATGVAMTLPWKMAVREAWAQYGFNSPNLTKFVDPIRPVGVIPLAVSDGTGIGGAQHYTIDIGQFNDLLHSDFVTQTRTFKNWRTPPVPAFISTNFAGTKLWGFNPANNSTPMHLGGVIIAEKGVPVQITFRNNLPNLNIIPVDSTIPGAGAGTLMNRTAIHLHGGFIPWISDGGPFDWWAPNGTHGDSFLNNSVLAPGNVGSNKAEYFYPNNQSERLLWYHDHAFGITRTNAYAGIASAYVISDTAADAVITGQGIPSNLELANTHYLIFQDKYFFGPGGPPTGYPANAGPGDLGYPYIYDPALFGPAGIPSFTGGQPLAFPTPVSAVPEMFGDTILVNGTAYPVLEVQAQRQRFIMLNACNSRFLNPRLVGVSSKNNFPGNAEPALSVAGPSFLQIGTEGGYLPAAVPVNGKKQLMLLIAPAERADLVVDFTGIPAGTEFILYNDAPGPYPGGASIFDYYPGNPKTPASIPGFGPNTRTLLKVRVIAGAGSTPLPATITLPFGTPYGDTPLVTQAAGVPIVPTIDRAAGTASISGGPQNVTFRSLTLNEGFDEYGRLAQFLGTNTPTNPGFFGKRYLDTPTEVVNAGSTEIWEIANLTADTHPIHFHLVNVQILARQAFSVKAYNGTPNFMMKPVAPDMNELGWKETVRMNPGEVIWVIMNFTLPAVPFTVPGSPRLLNDYQISSGQEYVWHCHILEHEEHDMMRPLVVV